MKKDTKTLDSRPLTYKLEQFRELLETVNVSEKNGKIKCFLSIGYKQDRAVVVCGVGNNRETAFRQVRDRAVKHIKGIGENPPWLKVDFVTWERDISIAEVQDLASVIKKYYFKFGISFDPLYQQAFLQQEINANCFFRYAKGENSINPDAEIRSLAGLSIDMDSTKTNAQFHQNNIAYYLRNYRQSKAEIDWQSLNEVTIFETKSYFFDEDSFVEIDDAELCNSQRILEKTDKKLLLQLLGKNANYLKRTVMDDGKFVYGYFSCFNREIDSYNIVRHALAVYSLAETYQVTGDESLLGTVILTLDYMMENYIYEVDEYAFAVDYSNNSEIKLGGLGVCVLALSKCLEVLDDFEKKDAYQTLMLKLGRGIIYMQNPVTGQFTHVLRYPDLELVEKFRIVYYSGEAAFALARIYAVDGSQCWLSALKKAFDYFIENNYWKNYDHWLAYCTNELTAILPEDKYFIFGLKNAFNNLNFVINRITTWATFMEMLMAAYAMIEHMKRIGKEELLEGYDIDKLKYAVEVRMRRQLNGVFFPEFAMYFKSPETILYGVFIRHHSFRVRNDDVAHHLSGYCHYISDFLDV